MFTRNAYALFAAAALMLAGVQAIAGDENLPEISAIGLCQELGAGAVASPAAPHPAGAGTASPH